MKPNRTTNSSIEKSYALARERYAALGVDTEKALKAFAHVSISIHCWQGDDLGGFESADAELGGGLAVTGNYPGKARTPLTSCARTSRRLSRSSPANIVSTSMPVTPKWAGRRWIATN